MGNHQARQRITLFNLGCYPLPAGHCITTYLVLITAVASGVVSLLFPILLRFGKGLQGPVEAAGGQLAEAIGQKAGQQVARLIGFVTKKFQGRPAAETALQDFVEMPDDEDSQAALRKELKKTMQQDAQFATRLERLLEETKAAVSGSGQNIFQSGSGSIATHGGTIGGAGGATIGGSGHHIEGGIHIGGSKEED